MRETSRDQKELQRIREDASGHPYLYESVAPGDVSWLLDYIDRNQIVPLNSADAAAVRCARFGGGYETVCLDVLYLLEHIASSGSDPRQSVEQVIEMAIHRLRGVLEASGRL